MTVGSFPENRKCTVCRSMVNEADALWEAGRPFHERCYRQHLAEDIARLDKKVQLGTITLAEARELADITELYERLRRIPAQTQPSKILDPQKPIFLGHSKAYYLEKPSPKLLERVESLPAPPIPQK